MGSVVDASDRKYKVFREHSADVALGDKAVTQGYCVTAQDSTTGAYTLANSGDKAGLVVWENNTRDQVAWAHCVPAVTTDAAGTIRPVAGQDLAADTTFAEKTLVLTDQGGDATKVRVLGTTLPDSGTYGLVVQALNQGSFELLWLQFTEEVVYEIDSNFLPYSYIYQTFIQTGSHPTHTCYYLYPARRWRSGAASQKIEFYTDGTYATKDLEYTNSDGIEFGYSNSSSQYNWLRKPCAGTGIANKTSYYPSGVHPWDSAPSLRYVKLYETEGKITGTATGGSTTRLSDTTEYFSYVCAVGDTIVMTNPSRTEVLTAVGATYVDFASGTTITSSTTYEITPLDKPNRESEELNLTQFRQYPWSPWALNIGVPNTTYDPTTDATSGGTYIMVNGYNAAYDGMNEEADDRVFVTNTQPFGSFGTGPVPGFSRNAACYWDGVTMRSDHYDTGGRVYLSKATANFHYWDGSAWQNVAAGTSLNIGNVYMLELWGSKDRYSQTGRTFTYTTT